ncbi:flippase-like domain-containing protein [Halomarina ordinaria]|uniref:Flippase-like domain-containing protein n=1 Tax=Halomarina ordinaria TaxID=3033939 RepID=A0ABD5U3J1_9EURY|nr:flippase-like domain-containing protein [Halomarina sp. PSRA2]
MDIDRRATLLGFLAALAVLLVVFGFVGIGPVLDTIRQADPVVLAALPFVAAAWVVAWGLSLYVILGVIGTPVRATTAVLVFLAATFANNVTPFGQAGGEPITAYLIADVTDDRYESGLAAIASADALNFVPSLSLAAVGIGYFAATTALGRRLRVAALSLVVVAGLLVTALVVGWRYRETVESRLADVLTALAGGVARLLPRREPPPREAVTARIGGFFVAVERVALDRNRLVVALGCSTVGWLALAASLWLSVYALAPDAPVSFAATLLVIPIAGVASVTPLPGGLGGVETVLITLLVATGATPVVAGGAVLVHRVATYWLPTAAGGVATATWGVNGLE